LNPVIIGSYSDAHAGAVAQQMHEGGCPPVVVDAATLERQEFTWQHRTLRLSSAEQAEAGQTGQRGWIRRLAPADWRQEGRRGSHEEAVRASWLALVSGILYSSDVVWLTGLPELLRAENKLVQYAAAADLGIAVPEYTVANRVDAVQNVLGDDVVVKPLGPGTYRTDSDEDRVLFTTYVELADGLEGVLSDAVGTAPFLFQRRVNAATHLRVVTVNDDVWVCALAPEDAQQEMDWRRSEEAHGAFRARDSWPAVQASALNLAKGLHAGFSSQDWVVDENGDCWFIDLNPSGQWLFLPPLVADAITASISRWLRGG
jgi:hypothetical protein